MDRTAQQNWTRAYAFIRYVCNGVRAVGLHTWRCDRGPTVLTGKMNFIHITVILIKRHTSSKYIFLPSPCWMNQSRFSVTTIGHDLFAGSRWSVDYSRKCCDQVYYPLKRLERRRATCGYFYSEIHARLSAKYIEDICHHRCFTWNQWRPKDLERHPVLGTHKPVRIR